VFNLGAINPAYKDERIALRVEDGKVKPYFDREAIDSGRILSGRGLELYYLRDYLDRYLLHIQGSGILELEDGKMVKVGYAGTNHFPYVSLGKELIREDAVSPEKMSLQAIREYFASNPEEASRFIYRNRRYIFFYEYSGRVKGSEGVELTPGRSIATDKIIFPGGGLAYIVSQRAAPDVNGHTGEQLPLARFVVDQDSGSAIKGPGRVDLFWGTGDEAGERAGGFKEMGELYYLLVKEEY
jgi:membrane-bound lytic murein transglycosylase A